MVVLPVDERDADGHLRQRPRGVQSTEAAAQNHDVRVLAASVFSHRSYPR